ncbi:TIGR01777 family oxidoreductase [bacterium]|nr:TIGR01777 family oxidoreductase [bacterium]
MAKTLKVLISGASGLIGSALVDTLHVEGHTVHRLVRERSDDPDMVYWKPSTGEIEAERLEGYDAVVHLAGENIASGRWNDERKAKILNSRVDGTHLLAETLAARSDKPQVFVCASATGYYGDGGETELTEDAPRGKGFLADVVEAWEEAAEPARKAGIRTVHLRFGVVLAADGGALEKMITPFKTGMAGKLGDGQQWMSWVSRDDAVSMIRFAIETESLSGPVNAVSPTPVTNEEFTNAMGEVLNRPTVLSIPVFALKMLAGEMAEEMLLISSRVIPKKLLDAGFQFSHTHLTKTLHQILDE